MFLWQRMKEVLAAFAAHPNHQNNHCAAVAVLTHGEEGYLYGVDGAKLHINTMVALFNARQCPALAGKPKMFILQACRGSKFWGDLFSWQIWTTVKSLI